MMSFELYDVIWASLNDLIWASLNCVPKRKSFERAVWACRLSIPKWHHLSVLGKLLSPQKSPRTSMSPNIDSTTCNRDSAARTARSEKLCSRRRWFRCYGLWDGNWKLHFQSSGSQHLAVQRDFIDEMDQVFFKRMRLIQSMVMRLLCYDSLEGYWQKLISLEATFVTIYLSLLRWNLVWTLPSSQAHFYSWLLLIFKNNI